MTAAALAAQLGLRTAGELAPAERASGGVVTSSRSMVPVTSDIARLLPYGGLAAATALAAARVGATSLLWRLLAGPTSAGAWCAVVGLSGMYPSAAAAAGVDLARLVLVEADGPRLLDAAAALAGGVPVLVAPSAAFTPIQERRLTARARRSGTAIVWWQTRPVAGADARLEVTGAHWQGLRANTGRRWGAGRLNACGLEVAARWRGGASRQATIWPYGGDRPGNVIDLRRRR